MADITQNSSDLFREWRKHSGNMRTGCGVSAAFSGWTSRADVQLVGFPKNDRCLDLLDCAWACRIKQASRTTSSTELRKDFWVNAAQAVQRRPWGAPKTLISAGCFYSYERDVCLDGLDMLALQGVPSSSSVAELGFRDTKDLAAEGFFLPSFGTVLGALYASPYASWWRSG